MTIFIWDSPATDITGRNLAQGLQAIESREKPRAAAGDMVICWGTKTSRDVSFADGVTVLNHPNAIRKNRNKYSALELMKSSRDLSNNIQAFCKPEQILNEVTTGNILLPVIGRQNYHQGGKGFWLCLTKAQISVAIDEGAQYFQSYIDIKDEYRLHVFDGKVIYAVKKVENATKEGWVAQRVEKVTDYASKNNVNIDADTLSYALGVIYTEQQLPDRIVRSNHRGWKFSNVRINNLPATLKNAAIKATEVVGLDFGAVDCCIDNEGNVFIIEINTGPGLQGTTFDKYIEAIKDKIQKPAARQPDNRRGRANIARAVGAEVAEDNRAVPAGAIGRDQALMMMRNVRNDEEARRLLELLME